MERGKKVGHVYVLRKKAIEFSMDFCVHHTPLEKNTLRVGKHDSS